MTCWNLPNSHVRHCLSVVWHFSISKEHFFWTPNFFQIYLVPQRSKVFSWYFFNEISSLKCEHIFCCFLFIKKKKKKKKRTHCFCNWSATNKCLAWLPKYRARLHKYCTVLCNISKLKNTVFFYMGSSAWLPKYRAWLHKYRIVLCITQSSKIQFFMDSDRCILISCSG